MLLLLPVDCANNLLRSSDAEGADTLKVLTDWGLTNDNANTQVTSIIAEKHFTLVPDSNVTNPFIRQSINMMDVGETKVVLRYSTMCYNIYSVTSRLWR